MFFHFYPFSFPHVPKIDRKQNIMAWFHITAVIPWDYTGKWLFPHTKGSITARSPLVIVFLNPWVRHPENQCFGVWLHSKILHISELLCHSFWLFSCHISNYFRALVIKHKNFSLQEMSKCGQKNSYRSQWNAVILMADFLSVNPLNKCYHSHPKKSVTLF